MFLKLKKVQRATEKENSENQSVEAQNAKIKKHHDR
jgi:hypothetical protein